ncbi:MAG: ACP S-malonyltransferase [Candidatus Methylopumilus sp.]|jgi:[acyl-carrier-protein] S-malonyltransferase|nr:ACP S-malonyltransferase [Candidatus Methylopumilus sp.]
MQFAMLFPGQGSQSVGMMNGFEEHAIIKQTFEHAADILKQDVWAMATQPNELLNQTTNTQPLMLIAGFATWKLWQSQIGTLPSAMAGHSLGEYTALVAAGVISFEDALPLVRYRAEVMQGAVAEGVGAMAAILGLEDSVVNEVCQSAAQGQVLEAVNLNSPGQVVIAGHREAVERGMEAAKAKGAKRALLLPVSVPSHCALMKPAADKLASYLQNVQFSTPTVQVLQNADVIAYQDAEKIKDALVRQLYSPVRWVETVQTLREQGITQAFECGPGKVLAGLAKRIVDDFNCVAIINNDALTEAKNLTA